MDPLLGSAVSRKFSGYGNAPWPGTVTRGPDDKGMYCVAWVDPRDRAVVDHQWHKRRDVEGWVTRRGPAVVTAPAPAPASVDALFDEEEDDAAPVVKAPAPAPVAAAPAPVAVAPPAQPRPKKKAKKALSSVGEQALARAEAVWAAAPAPAPRPKKVASKAAAAAVAAPAPATESADAAPAKKKRPRPSQGQRDRAKRREQKEAAAAAAQPQPPEEEEAALECVPRKTPKPAPAPAPAPGPPPLVASFAAPVRPSARAPALAATLAQVGPFPATTLARGEASNLRASVPPPSVHDAVPARAPAPAAARAATVALTGRPTPAGQPPYGFSAAPPGPPASRILGKTGLLAAPAPWQSPSALAPAPAPMAPPPDAAFWAAARGEAQRPRAAAPAAADPRARKRAKKVSAKALQAAAADAGDPTAAPARSGGLGGLGSYAPPGAPAPGRITIQVLGPRALEEETCVLNSTAALRELFKAHATRKGFAVDELRFSVANISSPTLTGNETPASLGLVDGSEIIVARCAPPVPARSGGLGGLGSHAPPGVATAAPAAAQPARSGGLGGLGSHAPPAPARGGLGGLASYAPPPASARIPKRERSPRAAPAEGSAHERRMLRQKDKARRKKSKFSPPVEGPFLAAYGPGDAETTTQVGAAGAYGPLASETYGPGGAAPVVPSAEPPGPQTIGWARLQPASTEEAGDDSGWGPKTFPRAPDTNIGEVLRVVSVPSVVVGLIVGGKGSNLDRLRRLYGNTQTRIADRDEPSTLGCNRRRRIAFTGAPEAIDACIEDVKQTLAAQSAKTGLPHTIEACTPPPQGWPTDALSGPLGHRELSTSIPAPFLPGAAAAAAGGGLNPATGLPHTAAYLKKAAAGVVPQYGPDGNAAVAAGTYGPAGMGAAPAAPVPGDNRLPGQRLVDALYDWLVANNRDGIDPTFMTEFHDACPGHRAKKCKGTGIKRTITQFGGDKLRWAHAPGGKGNGRVVVVGREQSGDDFRAPEDAGAYGPGGPLTETAFPQTYKYGTGIKKLAPGSPALILTGSLAPANPNRLPLANNAQGWAGPEDPASETQQRAAPVLQHHPAVRRNVVLLDLDQTLVHVLPSKIFPGNADMLAEGVCRLQASQNHEDQGLDLMVAVRKGASDLIWALRNAGNVDLRIVTMNLEGAGVIRAIADHLDGLASSNIGNAAYYSSLSLIWRDLPVTVIDAEARQRYRETGMPQKSLPADLSLSLIADDRLAIVDDTPGMWAHELQGRVVRVAPYAVNASFTPEALAFEIGPPHPYLAKLTRDFSSVLNARGRVWPLPGYTATSVQHWNPTAVTAGYSAPGSG